MGRLVSLLKHRWLVRGLLALAATTALLGVTAYAMRFELARRSQSLPGYTHQAQDGQTVWVTARDGVRLHGHLVRPKGMERAPTILIRNPYQLLRGFLVLQCGMLARYGYACLVQDVRGQLDSEGDWTPLQHERDDTLDALKWLVAQPFVDGHVAMIGASYQASSQWFAADAMPSEVKTLVPQVFGPSLHSVFYERGLVRHDVLTAWATLMPGRGMRRFASKEYLAAAAHRPHREADERFMGQRLGWYRDLLDAPSPGAAYWQSEVMVAARTTPTRVTMPLLLIGGHFDPFFAAQLESWQTLASKEQSVFVLGPWNHLGQDVEAPPGVPTGGLAQWPYVLEWLAHHLKGQPLKTLQPGTVLLKPVGSATWRAHRAWPHGETLLSLHLGQAESASGCTGGSLAVSPEQEERTVTYAFDPAHPVPTHGGASLLSFAFFRWLGFFPGPAVQPDADTCARKDVLTFRGAPLTADAQLSGALRLTVDVASSAPDTAFVARVSVEEDGVARLVREAAATLSYPRADVTEAQAVEPGTRTSLTFDFWPTEWRLKKGQRLRLDVTSSSFPALQVHSNRAGNQADQTGADVAQQTVFVGPASGVLTVPLASAAED